MNDFDPGKFHHLYGASKKRAVYHDYDFLDYTLMAVATAILVSACYGMGSVISIIAIALCAMMIMTFPIRHGVKFKLPVIFRRPQELLFMAVYKVKNIKTYFLVAVAVLVAENLFIALTPSLPHYSDVMRSVALFLFFAHLISISLYRTVILVAHLQKKELVREVLMQTAWKKTISPETNITLEVFHAYFTGLLSHIALVAPWYFVLTHVNYSVLAIPVVLYLNWKTQNIWFREYNQWYYRDHWLGHNSETEFVYLHGPHHDAIPSGLIGVSGNGYLEGFFRHAVNSPAPFYNPLFSIFVYTMEVKTDIDMHQYIPGIFPRMSKERIRVFQHSTHHFGQLEPYGIGMNADRADVSEALKKQLRALPSEVRNSIEIDQALTDFKWDNKTYKNTLELFEKYQK